MEELIFLTIEDKLNVLPVKSWTLPENYPFFAWISELSFAGICSFSAVNR